MAFPYCLPLDGKGTEHVLYRALRGVIVDREPSADAVLPAFYDDASPEERASIDRAIDAMLRGLCCGEEVQHGLQ